MTWFTPPIVFTDGSVLTSSDLNSTINTIAAGTVGVANGGTGLTAGTSGGVPYFSSTSAMGTSGLLTQYAPMIGGGAAGAPSTSPGAMTNGQLLIGSTGAAPVVASVTGSGITVTAGAGALALAPNPTRSTQDVTTSETTTSTSYTDLSTSGPAVTITPGRTTDQVILVGAQDMGANNAASQAFMSVAIAAAAAADVDAAATASVNNQQGALRQILATSVANGAVHTAKYRVNSNTGTFHNRRLCAFTLS